jgi:hypothetical protein
MLRSSGCRISTLKIGVIAKSIEQKTKKVGA